MPETTPRTTAESDSTDGEKLVHVHSNIGDNMDGAIIEVRPADVDIFRERDMSHLTVDELRDLRDQINDHLDGVGDGV